jgi:MFS transporter, DHA1 family, multidrug resistance protein
VTRLPPVGPAYYRLAVVLGSLTAMGPLAIDMYLPALPTITADLQSSTGAVQLSLAVYFFGIAIGQIVYGPLSDRWGRRPALLAGLGLFVASSVGCAWAATVEMLVVFRFAQALGGCAPLVVPRAIVRDYFDERGSARMLSVLMLVMGLAPILAPLIGGQLLAWFGWRSVFWVLAVYGGVAMTVAALALGESLPADRRRRESFGAVLATYRMLLRDRMYVAHVLTGGLIFAGLLAYIAGSPFVFIELFGVAPERFGLFFGINAIGIITASQINRWLVRRVEPRRVVGVVLWGSVTAGALLLGSAVTGIGGFAGILVPLFCYIAIHGMVMPNTTALAMAPHGTMAGSASALLGTLQFVLGALAGTLVGVLGVSSAVPFAVVTAECCGGALLVFHLVPRLGAPAATATG